MLEKIRLNLQLFADGGDGGDGGSTSSVGEDVGGDSGEDKILASIPEKARKYYQKATEKTANSTDKSSDKKARSTNETSTTEKIPYKDLIKGDYKDEHKAYMDEAIGERLKKYKGIEENLGAYKGMLDIVANKYGVNPDDENYLEVLKEKIDADDSYYENYALEHNVSNEEARRIVTMERKVAQYDALQEQQRQQEQARQQIMRLRQNAERTKAQFPNFDLDSEMQDERFRRLCAANNGDTTAAYMACHWNEILPATVRMASQQIQTQTANAVASNKSRPIENGLSSTAPSVVQNDFRNMTLQQLRAYADEQRRKK